MSETECEECDTTFDSHRWHPAMLAGSDDEMVEFCSTACKELFSERADAVTDSPTD